MSVASLANKRVTIERMTVTAEGWGGSVETWANIGRLSVRIQPLSAKDQALHERLEGRVTHVMYVTGTPDILEGDRISDAVDGKILYVTGVRNVDLADSYLAVDLESRDQ